MGKCALFSHEVEIVTDRCNILIVCSSGKMYKFFLFTAQNRKLKTNEE